MSDFFDITLSFPTSLATYTYLLNTKNEIESEILNIEEVICIENVSMARAHKLDLDSLNLVDRLRVDSTLHITPKKLLVLNRQLTFLNKTLAACEMRINKYSNLGYTLELLDDTEYIGNLDEHIESVPRLINRS